MLRRLHFYLQPQKAGSNDTIPKPNFGSTTESVDASVSGSMPFSNWRPTY
jgi:hypothetical protein